MEELLTFRTEKSTGNGGYQSKVGGLFLPINTTVKIAIFCLFAQNTQYKFASLTFGVWFLDQVLFLLLLQVNIGILIAVTRVISRISADNYKVHGDANAFK